MLDPQPAYLVVLAFLLGYLWCWLVDLAIQAGIRDA